MLQEFLATVRQCMEENGWDFSINGKTAKVSGFAGDENCIASRKASNSNVCNSGKPPSSQMVDGGALGGSTLTKRGGFDTVEVVIITIVVTLSIVFAGYIGHKKFMARRAVGDISQASNIDDVDHVERDSIFALHANPVTAGKVVVSGGGDAPHSFSAGKQKCKASQRSRIGGSSWEDVAKENSIFALITTTVRIPDNPVTAGKVVVSGGGDAPHSFLSYTSSFDCAGKQSVKLASESQFTDIGG